MSATTTNPAAIAKETFRLLASQKIAPTPDAYRAMYESVENKQNSSPAATLPAETAIVSAIAQVGGADLDKALKSCFKTIFKDAFPTLLCGNTLLLGDITSLADIVNTAHTTEDWSIVNKKIRELCIKFELKTAGSSDQQALLVKLFKLLIENVGALVDDDSWIGLQMSTIQDMLTGKITAVDIEAATALMKDIIYKQMRIKDSLSLAKNTVKTMMIDVIDKLETAVTTSGDFNEVLFGFTEKVTKARGLPELNSILNEVLKVTQATQHKTTSLHETMQSSKNEVLHSQALIASLETQLSQMSDLASSDELTGSLNRRGLDSMFSREIARAQRNKTPMCVAMLDLDDFKRLNDTYGHKLGDGVLIHLVKVIKNTIRAMDVVGRFGGEEFVIILPDTHIAAATNTIVRLQRELTNAIFLHEDRRLFVTFSAGVTQYEAPEDMSTVLSRADAALYEAKRQGKHRVVTK